MIRVTFEYSPPIDYSPPMAFGGEGQPAAFTDGPPPANPQPKEGIEDWLPLALELGKALIELLRARRNR